MFKMYILLQTQFKIFLWNAVLVINTNILSLPHILIWLDGSNINISFSKLGFQKYIKGLTRYWLHFD